MTIFILFFYLWFRRCVLRWDAGNRAPLCLKFSVCDWYLMLHLWLRRIWVLWCFPPLLLLERDYLALTVKPLILNLFMDFRFSYQISSSKEHRRYFMCKVVFIFAVHISTTIYRKILSFLRVSILLRFEINILYAVTLVCDCIGALVGAILISTPYEYGCTV